MVSMWRFIFEGWKTTPMLGLIFQGKQILFFEGKHARGKRLEEGSNQRSDEVRGLPSFSVKHSNPVPFLRSQHGSWEIQVGWECSYGTLHKESIILSLRWASCQNNAILRIISCVKNRKGRDSASSNPQKFDQPDSWLGRLHGRSTSQDSQQLL